MYSAKRLSDGSEVAMKFFGYTRQTPHPESIAREIELMVSLRGVEGSVQLIGVFDDTPEGLIPDKKFLKSYPVIVMEKLCGGDLYERIIQRNHITERYLAYSFKTAMLALRTLHQNGYIHRDLKIDNMVYVSHSEPSAIKLIDFGLMLHLPGNNNVLRCPPLVGTEGMLAPESILHFEYSPKTDIWQAGCILYTMLAGHPPFHSNPQHRYQITRLTYSPMTGAAWNGISSEAKDLVSKMLNKNPQERLDIDDILAHPWINNTSADVERDFGDDYTQRIKNLALRNKIKRAFLALRIEDSHKLRRECFEEVLPFLKKQSESEDDGPSTSQNLGAKIRQLKLKLVEAINNYPENSDNNSEEEAPSHKRRRLTCDKEINYSAFCNLVKCAGLDILAREDIFDIFDTNGDGTVDMKEFLLNLLALQPSKTEHEELEAAKLYFKVFDVDEDGSISKEELELVMRCLLHDGAGPLLVTSDCDVTVLNIEALFEHINWKQNGSIDFEEFERFYNAVLLPSRISRSTRSLEGI